MHPYLRLVISAFLITRVYSFPFEEIFGRAVGDSCRAKEGSGSCQNTSNCKGISYPIGLCPYDPDDVQVRPHPLLPFPLVLISSSAA